MEKDPQVSPTLSGDDDDAPVGRVWSRRELLGYMATVGGGLTLAACAPGVLPSDAATPTGAVPDANLETDATATPDPVADPTATAAAAEAAVDCVVSPELTEGPYFVDEGLNRSDVRSDPDTGDVKEGTPLLLVLNVATVSDAACTPLANALFDIWHCDADGQYSDVTDRSFNTTGQKWLRGQQVTDANGQVQFTTIYPGWYSGRAVHIHFKIRSAADSSSTYEFTSQFFFDPATTAQAYSAPPYNDRPTPDVPNERDGIYRDGGDQLVLPVMADGDGWRANFTIGMVV